MTTLVDHRIRKTHRDVYLWEMKYDPRVQRQEGVNEAHVAKIAANFNPLALGTIQVSLRPDRTIVVLDGWHRTTGGGQAGYEGPYSADVFEGLTFQEECDLFDLLNNTRKLSALSHFVARTNALDPDYVEMTRIIRSWGWVVSAGSSAGALRAVGAVQYLYLKGAGVIGAGKHEELLSRTLGVIYRSWGHDKYAASESVIRGLGKLLAQYPDANNSRLITKLQEVTPRQLIARAKARQETYPGTRLDEALADYVFDQYNRGLTTNALTRKPWVY